MNDTMIGKDIEGSGHGLFKGAISVFLEELR
jgi:hypothetical protein